MGERWPKACAAIRAAFSNVDTERMLRLCGHEAQAIADGFAIGQAESLTAWAFSLPDDKRRAYLAGLPAGEACNEVERLTTDLKAAGDTAKAWHGEVERLRGVMAEGDRHLANIIEEKHAAESDLANARGAIEVAQHSIEALRERAGNLEVERAGLAAILANVIQALGWPSSGDYTDGDIVRAIGMLMRLGAERDALGEAIEAHLPEHADGELLARIANAGAVHDERQRIVDAHEGTIRSLERELVDLEAERAKLTARLCAIAARLGANLPPPADRDPEDAALRIELGVADLQCAHATAERSRARWEARAKRAEATSTKRKPRTKGGR